MLRRHSEPLISGQLFWSNEGALSNLLLSPEKTKVCCSALKLLEAVVLLLPLAPYPVSLDALSIVHGTANSFPPAEALPEVDWLVWPAVSEVALAPVVLVPCVPVELDEELN